MLPTASKVLQSSEPRHCWVWRSLWATHGNTRGLCWRKTASRTLPAATGRTSTQYQSSHSLQDFILSTPTILLGLSLPTENRRGQLCLLTKSLVEAGGLTLRGAVISSRAESKALQSSG